MSSTPTPAHSSGYATPVAAPAASSTPKHHGPPKSKATNVFSNDGSFLQRFQHLKKDEEEKKKQEETLSRKRQFDNRFKNRGKRPPPDAASSNPATENPTKKAKVEEPMTQYQREVKSYAGRSLKDNGIGVRPLVK